MDTYLPEGRSQLADGMATWGPSSSTTLCAKIHRSGRRKARLSGTLRQCRAFGLDCRCISAARQHASRGRRRVMRVGTSSVGTPGARSCTAHAPFTFKCQWHYGSESESLGRLQCGRGCSGSLAWGRARRPASAPFQLPPHAARARGCSAAKLPLSELALSLRARSPLSHPDPHPHPRPRFAGDRGWGSHPRFAGDRGSIPIPIHVPIPDLRGIGDHPHPRFPSGVPCHVS